MIHLLYLVYDIKYVCVFITMAHMACEKNCKKTQVKLRTKNKI